MPTLTREQALLWVRDWLRHCSGYEIDGSHSFHRQESIRKHMADFGIYMWAFERNSIQPRSSPKTGSNAVRAYLYERRDETFTGSPGQDVYRLAFI